MRSEVIRPTSEVSGWQMPWRWQTGRAAGARFKGQLQPVMVRGSQNFGFYKMSPKSRFLKCEILKFQNGGTIQMKQSTLSMSDCNLSSKQISQPFSPPEVEKVYYKHTDFL